jgi:hypothetical protein
MINRSTTANTCHINRKIMQWCFQQHEGKAFLATIRHCTHYLKCTGTSLARVRCFFHFNNNSPLVKNQIASYESANNKKNLLKRPKGPWIHSLFFYFKSKFIILLYLKNKKIKIPLFADFKFFNLKSNHLTILKKLKRYIYYRSNL